MKGLTMRRIVLLALAALLLSPAAFAGGKKKAKAPEATAAATADPAAAAPAASENEVHWMSLSQAEEAMKTVPKKVWIDIYTDWCGWCKVMDKKTYTNPHVIQYLNEHFYAIRLNAEQKEPISFMGKQLDANQLAASLMQNRMSYPTSVFMTENFQNPSPIPGYQDIANMEMILKYFGQELYKKVPFQRYQQEFKATWL